LTDNSTVYEIVSDIVAPKDWETYLKHKGEMNNVHDFELVMSSDFW
jgi:hypothetical protein